MREEIKVREYSIPPIVKLKDGRVIDTLAPFPHVECYFIEGFALYAEHTSGDSSLVGYIDYGLE